MQQKEMERKTVATSSIDEKGDPFKESFDDDVLIGDITSRSFKLSFPRQGAVLLSCTFAWLILSTDGLADIFLAEPDVEPTIPTVPSELHRFEFNSPYYAQPQGGCTC